MCKTIDLTKTVHDLVRQYPQLVDIMASLGFKDITKPAALNTVGRIMTIPKGCDIKDVSLTTVVAKLREEGFKVVGYEEDVSSCAESGCDTCSLHTGIAPQGQGLDSERMEQLKGFIERLSAGEPLESVRADFVKHFSSVDAGEIAQAEQALISGGTPVEQVQKLCDVHSALFHQSTAHEQMPDADILSALATEGHPVAVFVGENNEIRKRINALRDDVENRVLLQSVRSVSAHYARKGDLIYPLLNRKYGFNGPSEVMWGVDDEIRDELRDLAAMPEIDTARLDAVLTRAEEMIYKENNILFPLCLQHFTDEDWMRIYYEMPAYETDLIPSSPRWAAAEAQRDMLRAGATPADGYIPLGAGHMTPRQIAALLNTLPMEITFVDDTDTNRYFNAGKGSKLFKRPDMAVDRDVYSCHPPKYQTMVRQIIEDFRAGRRDSVEMWMPKNGEPVLVRYMAVRDADGTYLGTMECVQPMGFAERHFMESK